MDLSTLYSMYSNAMSDGKLTLLKAFWNTIKEHPILATFYIWLILRNLKKAVIEFAKRFV